MTGPLILDAFAGPGGWDVGAARLGLSLLGVELEPIVCRTRRAAGHLTIRADVAAFPLDHLATGGGLVEGVILSPPCPDWSQAGKKAQRGGTSGFLVDEVLRWVRTLRPRWFACEQVPLAQPVWDGFAETLAREGYSTWTGKCVASHYGVPQDRKRSILIGSLDHTVNCPPATHGDDGNDGLFPKLPKVTMGEALGWQPDGTVLRTTVMSMPGDRSVPRGLDRPAPTVAFGNDPGGWEWITRRNDQTNCVEIGEVDPRWPLTRPATTIAGRGLVPDPGANANRFNGRTKSRNDGYKVTVQEAGILQDFPVDYPWQGNQGQQYHQVGDAVPPGLAAAVLAEAIGIRA